MRPLIGLALGILLWSGSARAAEPLPVTIDLGTRQAEGTPYRCGFTHTGGGNIDVQKPTADTVIVTMTGVAVAGAHPCKQSLATLTFLLVQDFEISFAREDKKENNKERVKKARLTIEARVIGLLRSHKCSKGTASITCPAHALVSDCNGVLLSVDLAARAVSCGENLSINDRQGPLAVVVPGGKYTLNQQFGIEAAHPCCLLPCKAASAEFAPDPALDPLWISYCEPFHGASKKDFGFQVILKVTPE